MTDHRSQPSAITPFSLWPNYFHSRTGGLYVIETITRSDFEDRHQFDDEILYRSATIKNRSPVKLGLEYIETVTEREFTTFLSYLTPMGAEVANAIAHGLVWDAEKRRVCPRLTRRTWMLPSILDTTAYDDLALKLPDDYADIIAARLYRRMEICA